MKEDRISQAIVHHGTRLAQWPWWMRCQVRRSWLGTPAARARLKQERELQRCLEAVLDEAPPALPAALLQRLDAIPHQYPHQYPRQSAQPAAGRVAPRSSERRLIVLGAGWALACSVVGISVGAAGWIAPDMDAGLLAEYAWGVEASPTLLDAGDAS